MPQHFTRFVPRALLAALFALVTCSGATATAQAAKLPASSAVSPDGTLSESTSSVAQGGDITFTYGTDPSEVAASNWVGVYSDSGGCAPVDQADVCPSDAWQATGANQTGSLTFDTSSLTPGAYTAYYLYDNGYDWLAQPVSFTVTPEGTLSTSTPTVQQGDKITFSYGTGAAWENPEDWIGIYSDPGCGPVNGSDVCGSTVWSYTGEHLSGDLSFSTTSLSPGKYIAYYLYDNGYTSLATPLPFTVSPVTPVRAPTYLGSLAPKGVLDNPGTARVSATGKIWVADTGHNRVDELSSAGALIRALGTTGPAAQRLRAPRSLAVWGGHVFVTDSGYNRVDEWTVSGHFVRTIGRGGSGDGEFVDPDGITARRGKLYVSDDRNNRIEVFSTSSGAYLTSFTSDDLSAPAGLTFDRRGHLWVANQGETDTGQDGLVELSVTGRVINAFESDNATTHGGFSNPEDVAVDQAGDIFVAQPDTGYVMELNPQGIYLNEFGAIGKGALSLAGGVALMPDGDLLVTDTGGNRLEIFKPHS